MPFRLSAAAGFAAVVMTAPAFADTLPDAIATIPGSVEDVRIVGTWEADDGLGSYRVVVARDHTSSMSARLFVQWISYSQSAARIDQSVEIAEVADLGLDVIDYNAESDPDGLSLYLEMLDHSDGLDETYELHLFSPTDYIFGPATN